MTDSEIKEAPERKALFAILKADPLYNDVSNLVLWKDPVKTGLLFGIFNFFFLLICWGEYSVATLEAYLLLSLLAVCVGYVNFTVLKAAWLQGKHGEHPFKDRINAHSFHLSRDDAYKHIDTVVDITNLTVDSFRDVFYCTNNAVSIKWMFYLYLFATVASWFQGETLVYVALLGLFVWPRLYQEKQKEIDQLAAIAKSQFNTYWNLAVSKIPPNVISYLPFLKPHSN